MNLTICKLGSNSKRHEIYVMMFVSWCQVQKDIKISTYLMNMTFEDTINGGLHFSGNIK